VPRFSDGSLGLDPADRTATKRVLEAAVAQGISFFVASHDSGAYMCQLQLPTDTRPTLSWPSDDPNVVSVGGTRLSVRQDGSYLSEQGWEDILSQSGTGGGVNPEDPLPDYQTDVYQADQNPQRLRQTPDVAASADPDSGFYVVSPNPQTEASEAGQVGGTSASTPFWAAAMLLVQQFAEQRGAGALGFVNPMLYAIAADPTAGSEPFHDVLRGGNRLHVCGPGWDFATGLGSPDVTALAQNVVDYLKRTNPNG
jgi:kumamolisin